GLARARRGPPPAARAAAAPAHLGRRQHAGGAASGGRAWRRLAAAGHLPRPPSRPDRRDPRAPPARARRRAHRDRRQQRVALPGPPVVRAGSHPPLGLGCRARRVASRAARAGRLALRRSLSLALVRRAGGPDRGLRRRGHAAPARLTMLLADRIVLVSGIGP